MIVLYILQKWLWFFMWGLAFFAGGSYLSGAMNEAMILSGAGLVCGVLAIIISAIYTRLRRKILIEYGMDPEE